MTHNTPICSISHCERGQYKYSKHGYCEPHYRRNAEYGHPIRPCSTCGRDMVGLGKSSNYCSDECKICTIDWCDRKIRASGLCGMHYQRKRTGAKTHLNCETCGKELKQYSGQAKYCDTNCRPRCKVDGCSKPFRSVDGYCGMHKVRIDRHGTTDVEHTWTPESDTYTCQACKKTFGAGGGSRKYCSGRCQRLGHVYGDNIPPIDFECAQCGVLVKRDRFEKLKQNPSRKMCDECSQDRYSKYRWFKNEVHKAGKADCGICGTPIDMSLKWPDVQSFSVDHIIPVSLGGSHDRENLQPAHLSCNARKSNRVEV